MSGDPFTEHRVVAFLEDPKVVEVLRQRGWVHLDDTLRLAPLAPIQRTILNASIFGVGVLTRTGPGQFDTIDPKKYVTFDADEVESALRAITTGEWPLHEWVKALYDPLVHALVSVLVDNDLIPNPKEGGA